MVNKDGRTAWKPMAPSVSAAAANADWERLSDGFYLDHHQPSWRCSAWPISASTFIMMPKSVPDAAAAGEALKFFAWAYKNGDKAAEELDYVAMPESVKKLVESRWSEIKGADGKPVFSH